MDKQMNERYDLFIEQYKEKEGITERLKAKDQIRWAEKMNTIQNRVEEIICTDFIYS
ncbi:hypothetical protein A9CBEGH2_07410 [Amedibacterium intestinale]|uniref:TnpV protein n=1 Tax=Amedibacterium intestinale TaxID=2583452 RepID=UPI000E2036B9|nr:TnpV protein [Erysipelotrichaceae bacterium AM17-60]BBK61801.1 hypothetical protein A9CBEGH2_07410 [Amedibacterium intestinale]